jgi:hypothetical protein
VQVEQGSQPESYLVEREECQGEEMTCSQAGVQVEQGTQPVHAIFCLTIFPVAIQYRRGKLFRFAFCILKENTVCPLCFIYKDFVTPTGIL